MEGSYFLIGLFLAVTGCYAIISGLGSGSSQNSDSTFDFKLFHIKAPIKIIYGLAAFAFIVAMVKVAAVKNDQEEIKKLNQKVLSLEKDREDLQQKLFYYSPEVKSFRFDFPYEPSSIFDGKILVYPYESSVWGPDSLRFTGLIGVAKSNKGPFESKSIEAIDGARFYLQTADSVVWGVNIFQTKFSVKGELFRD